VSIKTVGGERKSFLASFHPFCSLMLFVVILHFPLVRTSSEQPVYLQILTNMCKVLY
jgi:hypothetical protein